MFKSVIKEIIIMLLLCVAILLLLGIIFYEYIPTNKVVPNKVAYTVPENVAQELNQTVADDQSFTVTYRLTAGDLDTYEKTKDYDAGKPNPFAPYTVENNTSTNTPGGNTNTGSSHTNSPTTNANNNVSYLPDGGMK